MQRFVLVHGFRGGHCHGSVVLWPCDFGSAGGTVHHDTSAWWERQSADLAAGKQKDIKGSGHRHSPASLLQVGPTYQQ